MKTILALILFTTLASCGTVAGVGEDISGAVANRSRVVLSEQTLGFNRLCAAVSGCGVARTGVKATTTIAKAAIVSTAVVLN